MLYGDLLSLVLLNVNRLFFCHVLLNFMQNTKGPLGKIKSLKMQHFSSAATKMIRR